MKHVDFVGEYHLDLIVRYGACPVIVPRVKHISALLDAFEPFHGVLIVEGEDISPAYAKFSSHTVDDAALQSIRASHPGDTEYDEEKDTVEFELVRRCLQRNIPLLAICRGSQILNVACGGSLLMDVHTMLRGAVQHINYENYDDHRHPVKVLPNTPLSVWFDGASQLQVNSYHHQGIHILAPRFTPMAYSPDGLIEAYYDRLNFRPANGRFLMGLQFHPERMQDSSRALKGEAHHYDYPGCPLVYRDFVKAVRAYRFNLAAQRRVRVALLYKLVKSRRRVMALGENGLNVGTLNAQAMSNEQYTRLKLSEDELERLAQHGATVHGSTRAMELLRLHDLNNGEIDGECKAS